MDKIIIKDITTKAIIGVDFPERNDLQDLLINCELFTNTLKVSQTDLIKDTINYSSAVKFIVKLVTESSFHTVEALADYLSTNLIKQFNPTGVRIRVEKPEKIKNVKSVGVEIVRWNTEN